MGTAKRAEGARERERESEWPREGGGRDSERRCARERERPFKYEERLARSFSPAVTVKPIRPDRRFLSSLSLLSRALSLSLPPSRSLSLPPSQVRTFSRPEREGLRARVAAVRPSSRRFEKARRNFECVTHVPSASASERLERQALNGARRSRPKPARMTNSMKQTVIKLVYGFC